MKSPITRVWLAAALALIALAAAAPEGWAFQSPETGTPYAIPLKEFDLFGYRTTETQQASQAVTEALGERYGGTWQVYSWNPQTGTPGNLYGSGVNVASALNDASDVEAVARRVLAANAGTLGANPAELRLTATPHAMGKWVAHFQQTYRGLDVWGGRVSLTFTDAGRLFVMGSEFYSGIAIDATPRLSARQAEGVAQADLPFNAATDKIEDGTTLMVLPVPLSETAVEHHLAWRVKVGTQDPLGIWVTWVDAQDGRILWRYNDIDATNFTGHASIGRQFATWCNGETVDNCTYDRIQIAGVGETNTDALGNWTIPYTGSDPKTVTATLYGPYVNVQNYNGAEASFSGVATPGVPFTVAWTDLNARQDERDTFDAVNDVHDFIAVFDPTFGYTNARITAYVNRSDGYCPGNAWWDGTINFCAASGTYANTGEIQGVVHHEFCHGITDYILGSQGTQGIGEGNSDIMSNLITRESYIGRGFYTSNCTSGIRDSENNLQYPGDVIGQEEHSAGRVIAGFNWDFQQGMMALYGDVLGSSMTGERWHMGRVLQHPTTQPAQVLATFIADDDDGNLDNGTPHYDQICEGATHHGFSCPPILVGVFIVHTPVPSHEEQGDVAVTATIYSYGSVLIPSSLVLTYRVNHGQFTPVVMTPTGGQDEFQATIPDLMHTSEVEYYLQASDEAGYSAMDPPGAPTELHSFVVAPIAQILAEDVESGAPNWTHAPVSGGFSDQWHISTARNHTPVGASSWKCGDTGSGSYSNLLDAGLVTPPFELLSHSNLHFWQWIDAEESSAHPGSAYDGGLVEISANGGPWTQIFPDAGYTHTIRAGSIPGPFPVGTEVFSGSRDWHAVNFDLQAFSGTAQLRFRFGTDGAVAREGWYVDDLLVDGFVLDSSPVGEGVAKTLRYALLGSRANPITGATEIAFQVPVRVAAQLSIFDVNGRSVRVLASEAFGPGMHSVKWDGNDVGGQPVPSGVYFCRMTAGEFSATRRLVLSR
jgi:hypothetical protein